MLLKFARVFGSRIKKLELDEIETKEASDTLGEQDGLT